MVTHESPEGVLLGQSGAIFPTSREDVPFPLPNARIAHPTRMTNLAICATLEHGRMLPRLSTKIRHENMDMY